MQRKSATKRNNRQIGAKSPMNKPAKNPPKTCNADPVSGCPVPADPDLITAGWELRFFGDTRMAQEAAATYTDLNFEVRLEAMKIDHLRQECSGCKDLLATFNLVYTRKK